MEKVLSGIKEEIIKESEKLPINIKILLEKGKKLDKEWIYERNIIYKIIIIFYPNVPSISMISIKKIFLPKK